MSFKTVVETFESVSNVSGRNAKIALLDQLYKIDGKTFQEVVNMALNPFYTYRITMPLPTRSRALGELDEDTAAALWLAIRETLLGLKNRGMEVSAGRLTLSSALDMLPELYQKWICRIINRDLKMGVADFKKWFPNLVPISPVMLCDKWDGESLSGDWIAECKFDGYRSAVMVDADGNCDAVSRGNKEFWNWEHIAVEIKTLGLRNVVLDGEFYAGSWGQTSSIVKSQSLKSDRGQLKYFVFDMLSMDEWNTRKTSRNLDDRKNGMAQMFGTGMNISYLSNSDNISDSGLMQVSNHIVLSFGIRVRTIDEFAETGDRFYHLGYEGAVLKNLDSVYIWDRSSQWLKIKPEEDVDITVTGAEEGQGRHAGRLGAFIVEGDVVYKKKSYHVVSRVGGGLTDVQRDEYWKMYLNGTLEGLIIECRYQDVSTAITMSNGQPSLRFPRFIRERRDKMANA